MPEISIRTWYGFTGLCFGASHIRVNTMFIKKFNNVETAFINVKVDIPFLKIRLMVSQTVVSGYFVSMAFQAASLRPWR